MVEYFPYPTVRDGQDGFMADCAKAFRKADILVAHAPTGIGKTAAVLTAAVERALKDGKTIFFLTPKHTQHTIVVDTVRRMKTRHKVNVKLVDIIGKQWMCPHHVRGLTSREFNEFCRTQKKDELCEYYNKTRREKTTKKAREAVKEILKQPLHNEEVLDVCGKHKLCPYEVLLEAGRKADVIVCDYFHIFSPKVRRAFLAKLDKELEEAMLVVDEAHNLADRVRGIMSNRLGTYGLDKAAKEASTLNYKQLSKDLKEVARVLRRLAKPIKGRGERYVEKQEFKEAVEAAVGVPLDDLQADLEALGVQVLKLPKRYRSFAANTARFLGRWVGPDLGYTRILWRDDRRVTLSYRCLDAGVSCADVFNDAYSAVLMSGTLTPLRMYSDLLALPDNRTTERAYESPFPKENRVILLVPGLTTKYAMRGDYMYMKYGSTISSLLDSIPGNVAVFYPSYQLLAAIGARVKTGKQVVAERREMKKDDRRRLFNRLMGLRDDGGGVLMAVQAGSFSEGLDYADNLLDAVVIVGLPLEYPNLETQALIDYYDFKYERGWDYGYIYPAVNRSLQAAGRCIRSETDRGAIILLDERFKWANYRKCYPSDFEFITTEQPVKYLERFFS
jgi:DNA excision repair protein ERCC-2